MVKAAGQTKANLFNLCCFGLSCRGQQLPWQVRSHRPPKDFEGRAEDQGRLHRRAQAALPGCRAQDAQVTFNVDSNGILEVTAEAIGFMPLSSLIFVNALHAQDMKTHRKGEIQITNEKGGLEVLPGAG